MLTVEPLTSQPGSIGTDRTHAKEACIYFLETWKFHLVQQDEHEYASHAISVYVEFWLTIPCISILIHKITLMISS